MARSIIALLIAATLSSGAEAVVASRNVLHGAIAYHRDSSGYGFSVDQRTARAAQVEALRQCGHQRCEVVVRLRNSCGAVANGPKKFAAGKGAARQEAETKALRSCGAGCEIVVWACTR